ncbi:hypothetical protein [Bradyrhizobium sp. USDA 4451]
MAISLLRGESSCHHRSITRCGASSPAFSGRDVEPVYHQSRKPIEAEDELQLSPIIRDQNINTDLDSADAADRTPRAG